MRELNRGGLILFWGIRLLVTLVAVAIPVLGVWVGTSLAAYLNGPIWAVILAGLVLFPILPVGWTIKVERTKAKKRKRWDQETLTFFDRAVIYTFVLNGAFVAGMLFFAPESAFTALSGRGDWMLDRVEHPAATRARSVILGAADRLEWLYTAAHVNEFEEMIEEEDRHPDAPDAIPEGTEATEWDNPWNLDPTGGGPTPGAKDPVEPPSRSGAELSPWPVPAVVHPAVRSMAAADKRDVEAVAAYLKRAEPDPYLRIKAIHDFVAEHVSYDSVALAEGRYPPQDARTVLTTSTGVCAGYANLAKAIADASGDEVVVVVGDSREEGGQIAGGGHAWNAAKIEDRWYLFDATWDSGRSNDGREGEFSTSYLFIPPAIMGVTHFPDDARWQLRAEPLSRGEFTRQPMVQPRFFAMGFGLESPTRSQITVRDRVEIVLANPGSNFVLAHVAGRSHEGDCTVTGRDEIVASCSFEGPGTYQVKLFASENDAGVFPMIGQFEVISRG